MTTINAKKSLTLAATAFAALFAVGMPQRAYADEVKAPPVPANIEVPAGNEAFLVGHAVGSQNYVCLPSGVGVAFVLFTPEATLLSDDGDQVTTHFFGPNPFERNTNPAVVADGIVRAAWQHSRDTSTVWGQVKPGNSSSDAAFVAPDAIAWLLVTAVGAQAGPEGGNALAKTTFIQRLNTSGGLAPSTGCSSPADVGRLAFIPYTADYFFYKAANRADHGG
jgi:uncharacterized protein DUF3455